MNYRIERQLSVNLKNTPGQLAEISDLLARHQLSISALTLNPSGDDGALRLTVCDPVAAQAALESAGFSVTVDEVLTLLLRDSKGKLASLTRSLWKSGINIDYMYASVDQQGANSRLVLKVSNIPLAARVIEEVRTAA